MKYIVRLIGWVMWKLGYLEKVTKCEHNEKYVNKQWFADDGTPMSYFHCLKCDYLDSGHVHGDPEQMRKDGWEKEVYFGM